MNINDVVKHALAVRDNAPAFTRFALEANLDTDTVLLRVYPFNGVYLEERIGTYSYYIHNNKIKSVWIGS